MIDPFPVVRGAPRRYHGLRPLLNDILSLLGGFRRGRGRGGALARPFRQRLRLVVTGANRCRYCAYGHARLGAWAGLAEAEVDRLLGGDAAHAPLDERRALHYALHWAETDAMPDPEARRLLEATYGPETARAIEVVLRGIRIGNLVGNSMDHFLSRLTRGRIGRSGR